MRKNTAMVVEAVMAGKSCRKCEAIHTDGKVVRSYRTVVAVPSPNGEWYVNAGDEHSKTTTIQVNGLAYGIGYVHKKTVHRVNQNKIEELYAALLDKGLV